MGGGCKKVENGVRGVFVKKVENGGAFFVKKSGPFLNAGYIMNSISKLILYFTLTFYLFGGRTHPTQPPVYGRENTQYKYFK